MVRTIALAYRDAYSGLSKEVWILSVALFINRCGSMVLAFLTLYLTVKLGFSIFEAGAIFSVYGMGSMIGSYLGGRLIRPVGAVRVQIVGLALAGPLFFMVPLFSTWTGVAASVFLVSLFAEAVRPANNVAITQFTPPELHTRAFGLQRMAVNLGISVGPAVGGLLAEIDFLWLFVVDGITTIGGAVFSMVIITIGEMFMFPVATGFVAERGTKRDTGMYMSWYAMTYSLSSVLAPLIGSTIYETDPDLVWYLSIGVGVFALAGFYLLAAKTKSGLQSPLRS